METKPIVTSHGNQTIFSSLHAQILKGLPSERVEWRRSYGRPPKAVKIEASFVPYDEDILPRDTDKTLISRPYFHIFWADADVEVYKQSTKDEINEWYSALKKNNNPDWLIVVVSQEARIKTKLLPRSTVIDKVKNDFCSRNSDRCVALHEPLSLSDQKSLDSWKQFLQRVRALMLQAFNRHLVKYEENLRNLRDSRNDPGWDFINFFVVQEELAFMFEMLGLYDDALIQYDELDALFTQYVLTQENPKQKIPEWLKKFSGKCESWNGLNLRKAINLDMRDQVKHHEASLIDFRNYLFSRQCALLFLLSLPMEVVHRALSFLHQTLHEVHGLKVELPVGAKDCWVYLSCNEIIKICQKNTDSAQMDKLSKYTASLWDYARKKLYKLGSICGILPSMEPSSDQLELVVELSAGVLKKPESEPVEENDADIMLAEDKLRSALSSKEDFSKVYLEMSEIAMGTYKHIGRFRSARSIGYDLAKFYMSLGDYQKAENFMQESVKGFEREGWYGLSDEIRLELAQCQKKMGNIPKFVKTCCIIACSSSIPEETKKDHFQQLMDTLQLTILDPRPKLKLSLVAKILDVTVVQEKLVAGEEFMLEVKVHSKAPCVINCNKISVSLQQTLSSPLSQLRKKSLLRQTSSNSSQEFIANVNPISRQSPSVINMQASLEGSATCPTSVRIICLNTHELLQRSDSIGKPPSKGEKKALDDGNYKIVLENMDLIPGYNLLCLKKTIEKPGQFKLGQIVFEILGVNFIHRFETEHWLTVAYNEPEFQVLPTLEDHLFCGIQQEIQIILDPGSHTVREGDTINVSTSDRLQVLSETAESLSEVSVSSVQDGKAVISLYSYHSITSLEESIAFITLQMNNWKESVSETVKYLNPFEITHKLHTAKQKKYIQVIVHGKTKADVLISGPALKSPNADVELLSLNKKDKQLAVNSDQYVSYIWELKVNTNKVVQVPVQFKVTYEYSSNVSKLQRQLHHDFSVENFATLYSVNTCVKPAAEAECCTVGVMATLRIRIIPMVLIEDSKSSSNHSVYYEVQENDDLWAVCSKRTGVMQMKDLNEGSLAVDVMPMVDGNIALPTVKIHQYQSSLWTKLEDDGHEKEDTDDSEEESLFPKTKTKIQRQITPFNKGQVYYASIGHSIKVEPP